MFNVTGATAIYLIEGVKKCLIDGGTRNEASRLIKTLKELNAFPPDIIIVTHSHWDHTQAIPIMRKKAAMEQKRIEVMASETAIPFLEDQSFNKVFHEKEQFENITDVTPLKEGEIIDLGGISLKILDVPGHMKDHIAILDESTKNIFVGDALGYKVGDQAFAPSFMPPHWDRDAFYASITKLKQIDYTSLCLAHFGYIYGDEAKTILDEAISTYELWWQLFDNNVDKLDDIDYMIETIVKETNTVYPEFKILSKKLKVLYGLLVGWKKLTRKRPPPVGELLVHQTVEWLVKGYKISKNL